MSALRTYLEGTTQLQFGREIGVSQSAVAKWLKDGVVSPKYTPIVSAKTGIPREVLNPLFSESPS